MAQIEARETAGQTALYESFGRGLRFYFSHYLHRQDVEDRVHDTLVAVVFALRHNHLQEPACLPGYVYTIARRQVAAYIAEAVRNRAESVDLTAASGLRQGGPSAEQQLIDKQQREMARQLLASLPEIDQQILLRFYYRGQLPAQICAELSLTDTQFRLRKSRAKKRFEEMVRKTLRRERLFSALPLRQEATPEH